ncbi:dihydrofolate reductase [Rhodobacter sp. NTK016B]|uniref:dihydrofolate reductase family protein n=1 Tax=Rhodobacter sp. NTK016B TaxID=2759676 RepID=UPI001A8CDB93|nr:dihydrofolate reductase family protein [Rhodobacter sp. NTK016B]MBN8290439.1 dihydrofolate reductase [Rhodobacter sp. NTK016B]
MRPECHVFIAATLDGYIADPKGGIDWLTTMPVPEGEDFGYGAFMTGIDAIVMGAGTFETLRGFPDWPYEVPVIVLSQSLGTELPAPLPGRARVSRASPEAVMDELGAAGIGRVYVDGGQIITSFLRAGLVDRLTVTRVPLLLGGGRPLFGETGRVPLRLVETRSWENGFVQTTYARAQTG